MYQSLRYKVTKVNIVLSLGNMDKIEVICEELFIVIFFDWKVFCILWKLEFHHLLHSLFLMLYFMVYYNLEEYFLIVKILFSVRRKHMCTQFEITSEYALIARFFYEGIWVWMKRKVELKHIWSFVKSLV